MNEPTIMEILSSCIRGAIIAPPENKLICADLANIEGRVLAWVAGEEWKVQAFLDFDQGTGADLYKLAYAKAFGVKPESVISSQRQIGKVMELALGYQGGAGAFATFASAYNIDLEKMADQAIPVMPLRVLTESMDFLKWTKEQKRGTYNMSDRAFVVCDAFKRLWREAHPNIVALWNRLGSVARAAIDTPGEAFDAGPLRVRRVGNWLGIKLPSGRVLCYPSPRVDESKPSYMGLNQYNRKWERIHTYGGKLVENCVQAMARDILAHGMTLAEARGYQVVLSVHDELICETPDTSEFSPEGLAQIMTTLPDWATGLPLAAEGFQTKRYRK